VYTTSTRSMTAGKAAVAVSVSSDPGLRWCAVLELMHWEGAFLAVQQWWCRWAQQMLADALLMQAVALQ
jgi:hypothetical protein